MTTVTIITACRNEAAHIAPFLASIDGQQAPGLSVDVVIADGMSTDGTREIVAAWAQSRRGARVIDNPERIVSTGLNRAIRASAGEIIVRMDVHTEYASDYVAECVRLLHETGADNVGGPARTRAHGAWPRAIRAAYHARFSTGGARFHDENYEGPVDTVTYGCWRRTTLERAGLFDESLVRNQDDELNLRLTRAGGVIWQSPRIRSWYSPRASLGGVFRQYYQYGFWKVAVIRKHRLPGSVRHVVPGAAAALAIVLAAAWTVAAATGSSALLPLTVTIAALAAGYGALSLAASVIAARGAGWDLLPLLPFAFAAFHAGYGLGFLNGIVYFASAGRRRAAPPSSATQLTR